MEALNAALIHSGVKKAAIHSEEFGAFTPTRSVKKGQRGVMPILGIGVLVLAAVAVHLAPVWLLTNRHLLGWQKALPISIGVAAVVLIITLVKLGLFLFLRSTGRRLL